MTGSLPMFPLGSVLFPHMPLALRVFEERYLVMLARILSDDAPEFGVVLIEGGVEVGGGDRRWNLGTVARIAEVGTTDGVVALLGRGERRVEVLEWLADDPHPEAVVRRLPELVWEDRLQPLLDQADSVVRRGIARAGEYVEIEWDADVELSEDPVEAAWQLAAIAPLGELDQVRLLGAESTAQLLQGVIDATIEAGELLSLLVAGDDLDAEIAEALSGDDETNADGGSSPDEDGASDDGLLDDGPLDGDAPDDRPDGDAPDGPDGDAPRDGSRG